MRSIKKSGYRKLTADEALQHESNTQTAGIIVGNIAAHKVYTTHNNGKRNNICVGRSVTKLNKFTVTVKLLL